MDIYGYLWILGIVYIYIYICIICTLYPPSTLEKPSHSQMETGQPAGAAAAIGVRAFLQQGLDHALLVRLLPLHLVSDL